MGFSMGVCIIYFSVHIYDVFCLTFEFGTAFVFLGTLYNVSVERVRVLFDDRVCFSAFFFSKNMKYVNTRKITPSRAWYVHCRV